MSPQDFLASFHEIANAPGGVARLRELILELAVQGRLLPQSSGDESASNSLERIRSAKADIVPSGRRKKTASIGSSYDHERPLPKGWSYCALADLVTVLNGRAYAKEELLDRGTPVLRVGNLFTSNHWYYSNLELEEDKYCDAGDLIFAWSASFGPFIWQGPKVIYHYHIWKLKPHLPPEQDISFLYWFLQNKTQEIKNAGHGVSMVHMTKEKMEQLTVALPPLAEQKRIVGKVEELMALCDALEAQQEERDRLFPRLSRATHTRLTDAPSQPHLDSLFTDLSSISPEDMRRTILEMVVTGAFTPDAHVREVNLGDVITLISGQHLLADEQNDLGKGIPYITGPADFGTISPEPKRWTETPKVVAEPGDIVITVKGAGVGKTNVVLEEPLAISRQLMSVRVRDSDVDAGFIHLVLRSTASHFQKLMTGIAIPGIGRRDVLDLKTSLPPLTEQRRIVAKVDELMALVDTLEAQQQEKSHLAESFAQACVTSITGTRTETEQKMKAPDTELISLIRAGETPPAGVSAPLATLIAKSGGEMQAKALWQQSGVEIDAFYQQLKTELTAGWIEPQPAEVRVVDGKASTTGSFGEVVVTTKKPKRRLG